MLNVGWNRTTPLRVLCLGSHSDDLEIGCGGTLLKLIASQPPVLVHWVVFSASDQRAVEARASAGKFLAGAEPTVEIKSFRDGFFPYLGTAVKDYFEELKTRCAPDLIFTHYRSDRHQDHRLISDLTWNTFRDHLILEYEIPKYDGDLGSPNFFVPLDLATCRRKVSSIIESFQTQHNRHWFTEDTFFSLLRLRGVEAERLLLEGALPEDVDGALTDFGFPMGPFAMADLAGLDVGWRMRKAQGLTAPIADQLCERGHYGQKTGRGFYRYDKGSRTPKPDPEVEELIVATAAQCGIARSPLGKDTMVERLLFPMINEGARILREGIAQRPGDIDVIWVYGYGFPVYRGGPMHYADSVGLGYIRDKLASFARRSGDERHRPAPLLTELAAAGRGFASLRAESAVT